MNVGDRVSITDPQRTHEGSVTTVKEDGTLIVKWDSGMTERLHESEVTPLGAPVKSVEALPEWEGGVTEAPPVAKPGAPLSDDLNDEPSDGEGYDLDDPKHPTFRERMVAFWDALTNK